jgi:hypothetical protein
LFINIEFFFRAFILNLNLFYWPLFLSFRRLLSLNIWVQYFLFLINCRTIWIISWFRCIRIGIIFLFRNRCIRIINNLFWCIWIIYSRPFFIDWWNRFLIGLNGLFRGLIYNYRFLFFDSNFFEIRYIRLFLFIWHKLWFLFLI